MSTSLVRGIIWGGWWLAVLCAAVGVGAALLSTHVTPPLWTANTTLTVQGPDVQDTSSGFLVTEMGARSAAELVMRSGFVDGLPGHESSHLPPEVDASVPFSTSHVVITVTADDRDDALATANGIALRLIDRVHTVSAHIAISPAEQRVAKVLPVRLLVLTAPSSPKTPSSPQVGLNILAGAGAGFALGGAAAVLRECLHPVTGVRPRRRRTKSHRATPTSVRGRTPDGGRSPGSRLATPSPAVPLTITNEGRRAC